MKAVVLEIRNGIAAVLREDGVVVTTSQKCAVGDTIEIKTQVTGIRKRVTRFAAAAAAAVLVLTGGGIYGYQQTAVACSYVSLDMVPSIEYVLNRQDRVLEVSAVNEDAQEIVEELQEQGVKNDTLEEALKKTEAILEEKEYLSQDEEGYILVNVASDSDKHKEQLTEIANNSLGIGDENVTLVVTDTTVEERDKARDLGISAGRYEEMKTIGGSEGQTPQEPDAAMVEKYREAPVRQMFADAGRIPGEEPGQEPQSGGQDGNGSGQEPQRDAQSSRPEQGSQESGQSGGSQGQGSQKSGQSGSDPGQQRQEIPDSQGSDPGRSPVNGEKAEAVGAAPDQSEGGSSAPQDNDPGQQQGMPGDDEPGGQGASGYNEPGGQGMSGNPGNEGQGMPQGGDFGGQPEGGRP